MKGGLFKLKVIVSGFVSISLLFPLLSGASVISPGTVITKDNLSRYSSGLKELLIPGYCQHILSGEAIKRGWITIPVVKPKWEYRPPPGFRAASQR